MKAVTAREFFRSPYKFLKELPIVVTVRGKQMFVVTKVGEEVLKVSLPSEHPELQDEEKPTADRRDVLDEIDTDLGFNNTRLSKEAFTAKGQKRGKLTSND